MRAPACVLIASLALSAGAYAGGPALEFPSAELAPLPRSLMEDAARRMPEAPFEFAGAGRAAAGAPRSVSHMPIVSPKGDIDPGILKQPEASTDFKLVVKPPEVDPAR